MSGFHFEKNLDHQSQAVNSTLAVFEGLRFVDNSRLRYAQQINPEFDVRFEGRRVYEQNLRQIMADNQIEEAPKPSSNIIDIMMETGTGKTYTYTKTMFALNSKHGITKFILVVPTLSIKAGTISFLKSDSCRQHFSEQYGKTLTLHVVESQSGSKASKKSSYPTAVSTFVNATQGEKDKIHVLIINTGMINSKAMEMDVGINMFEDCATPFQAIAATKAVMMIDEPHKYDADKTTWGNLQKMGAQFILRYGATFPEKEVPIPKDKRPKLVSEESKQKKEKVSVKVKAYENLVYQLSAVDAFNRNLVKGIIGHTDAEVSSKPDRVEFKTSDGKEATFSLNGKEPFVRLQLKESLSKIHDDMSDLNIVSLNKSTVVLSNGREMKTGDTLYPNVYSQTVQERMIRNAVKHHFDLEEALLTRPVRIKPLTLFFIDNIEEYRNKEGFIRKTLESAMAVEIKARLKTVTHVAYKAQLEKTALALSAGHGGYFSQDNSDKDAAIEKEINEILHDKQALLDLDNPRRFVFSKWTLREGWDNPNVFQICKLRSSGSETSKLQEVGRGLRLPVNEYGNRVKDEIFHLNYFVDFSENDFVKKLADEINQKSGAMSIETEYKSLNDATLITKILQKYAERFADENELLVFLDDQGWIKRNNDFKEGGLEFVRKEFPLIFEGVNSDKVGSHTEPKKRLKVRTEKYSELKALWEQLNQKVILAYQFENEAHFKTLLVSFLRDNAANLSPELVSQTRTQLAIENHQAQVKTSHSMTYAHDLRVSTMKYSDFLQGLASKLIVNRTTLHYAILEAELPINDYLNPRTISLLQKNFQNYLMANAMSKFEIDYQTVNSQIHPTKLTDNNGRVLDNILASDAGVLSGNEAVATNYFFESLYYDSDLEKKNITTNLEEVIVFTKIPKNSIKIPVAGGASYSPDFAYVLKFKNGEQKLNFIVESKGVDNENELRQEEFYKIEHAKRLFKGQVQVKFETQFKGDKMMDLIKRVFQG